MVISLSLKKKNLDSGVADNMDAKCEINRSGDLHRNKGLTNPISKNINAHEDKNTTTDRRLQSAKGEHCLFAHNWMPSIIQREVG